MPDIVPLTCYYYLNPESLKHRQRLDKVELNELRAVASPDILKAYIHLFDFFTH